ncbi:MAG: site-specific integrase [Prevotella sp.]|nr:site-specific integrase [Prevotella sp.]
MSVTRDTTTNFWTVQYRYTDWTGKVRHMTKRGFKTKKEAIEWENGQRHKFCVVPEITVRDFVDIYFRDKSGELKERTIKMKKYMIDTHISNVFGNKKMKDVTPSDVIQWQNMMRDKKYSESYLRMAQNQLSGLFNHACNIYGLMNNPCKRVKKMGNANVRRLEFWTLDEYETFIGDIDKEDRYHVIFETLFWTGMRVGELLALTPADISFVSNRIEINKTYFRMDKKDLITSPKTETSKRIIDIPQFLSDELKHFLECTYSVPDDGRIFPIVAESIQHKLKRICAKTGVKRIPVHSIRHSSVAYLISQGVQPLVIKERMGHANIKITLDTYGHLYPNQQKEVADMLNMTRNKN